MFENLTEDLQGQPGDGTTIDREEPFIIRIRCDGDGWILQVNQEPAYDTFLHRVPVSHILNVKMTGSTHISYVGFGTDGKQRVFFISLITFLRFVSGTSCWVQCDLRLSSQPCVRL